MARTYPPEASEVHVIYVDGEVRTFSLTAGNGIAHHLMKEAASTGVLVMRDDNLKRSICIPLAMVRHIEIQTVDPNAVIEKG
jgi:hypothetical protein